MDRILIECLTECANSQKDDVKRAIIEESISALSSDPQNYISIIQKRLGLDVFLIGETVRSALKEAKEMAAKCVIAEEMD